LPAPSWAVSWDGWLNHANAKPELEKIVEKFDARENQSELEDRDPFTADLLTSRIGAHDKAAWMLRSLLA
jgi:DNA-binding ferritin-like protein